MGIWAQGWPIGQLAGFKLEYLGDTQRRAEGIVTAWTIFVTDYTSLAAQGRPRASGRGRGQRTIRARGQMWYFSGGMSASDVMRARALTLDWTRGLGLDEGGIQVQTFAGGG